MAESISTQRLDEPDAWRTIRGWVIEPLRDRARAPMGPAATLARGLGRLAQQRLPPPRPAALAPLPRRAFARPRQAGAGGGSSADAGRRRLGLGEGDAG